MLVKQSHRPLIWQSIYIHSSIDGLIWLLNLWQYFSHERQYSCLSTELWSVPHYPRMCFLSIWHYNDVIMGAMASQITSLTIVYSTVYSGVDQRKHQRPASLAFVRGIHRWPVNSPRKGPVTRKMFAFDDVIMFIAFSVHTLIAPAQSDLYVWKLMYV